MCITIVKRQNFEWPYKTKNNVLKKKKNAEKRVNPSHCLKILYAFFKYATITFPKVMFEARLYLV